MEVHWQLARPEMDNAGVAFHAFLLEGLTRGWDLEALASEQCKGMGAGDLRSGPPSVMGRVGTRL